MVMFNQVNSLLDEDNNENKRGTDTLAQPVEVIQPEGQEGQKKEDVSIASTSQAPIVASASQPKKVTEGMGKAAMPSTAVAQAVMSKNVATPLKAAEGVKTKIKETKEDLESKSSQYVTDTSKKAEPTIDEAGLKKTFETGEGLGGVRETLETEDLDIPEFTYEANLPEREVEALRTREGQEQLLVEEARKETPQYTTGMAALDIGLARKQPADYSDVLSAAGEIPEQYRLAKEKTDEAVAKEQEEYDTKRESIRTYLRNLAQGQRAEDVQEYERAKTDYARERPQMLSLAGGIEQEITQGVQKEADDLIAGIPKLEGEVSGSAGSEMIEYADGRTAFLVPKTTVTRTPENKPAAAVNLITALKDRVSADIDANAFITSNMNTITADSFITNDEATRFNRVMELLGEPTRVSPGTTPSTSFNERGYRDAVVGATNNIKSDMKAIADAFKDVNVKDTQRDAQRQQLVRDIMAKYGIADVVVFPPTAGLPSSGLAAGSEEDFAGLLKASQERN